MGRGVRERMHPLTPLVNLWVGVLALGWFGLTSLLEGDLSWEDIDRLRQGDWVDLFLQAPALIGVGAVMLLTLAFAYWGWWTRSFVVDDHELRIENSGAFQESQRIAFSRIQSVDVTQPFAARLLGLAQVNVDVGADAGVKLSFLTRARTTAIRDYLTARARGRAATTVETAREASGWDDSAVGDELLIRLSAGDILLGALVRLEIVGLVLVFLIPMAIAAVLGEPLFAVGGGLVPLVLALFGYLSKNLINQFNYTLARTPGGLRITRGLFTLSSQTVPAHRVQSLQISQPAPWRLFNRAQLHVTVLGSQGSGGDDAESMSASMIYLPIGTPQQVQLAISAIWPGLELERLRFSGPDPRGRIFSPLQFSWMGHALDDRVIAIRSGWAVRRQLVVPHGRIQAVELSQGPLDRRRGIATVQMQTIDLLASNVVEHLDAAAARRLAFDELDRARTTRTAELVSPPGLAEAPLVPHQEGLALTEAPVDLWLPPTAPLAPAPL